MCQFLLYVRFTMFLRFAYSTLPVFGYPPPPPLEVMAQALYLVSLDLVQTRVPSSTSVSCGSPWDSISCVLSALKIGFPVDTD